MRFTLFFCCVVGVLYSQNQENIWYFGRNAGVSFDTSPPTVLTNGKINTIEGSAAAAITIAGRTHLLFYTDGKTVYKADHSQMDNGDNLNTPVNSSTQAALIVPRPNFNHLFYIFSIGDLGGPLKLASVNMTRGRGWGEVTNKGRTLEARSSERLTGIYHANKRDIWVTTHEYKNDYFNVYLVSLTGMSAPIRQQVGSVHKTFWSAAGYLKPSHDGQKLALAVASDKYIEIFDFDNATGRITNPIRINTPGAYVPYGLEFSPNNRVLYVSEMDHLGNTRIIQYNLTATDIAASRYLIKSGFGYGALLLASDQKIYYVRNFFKHLGVIHNPNTLGANVRIDDNGINLGSASGNIGLPNFVRGSMPTVKMSSICANVSSRFELTGVAAISSAIWDFGDGRSSVNILKPRHTYARKGLYTVRVDVVYASGTTKTLTQIIQIDSAPVPSLSSFPNFCPTDPPITLTQGSPTGGIYSGRGVNTATSIFSPALAGPGTIPITYIYTNANGCSNFVTANILVKSPTTLIARRTTICIDSGNVKLDVILPGGGTYTGRGVIRDIFSPTAAGLGTHTITYTLASACPSTTNFNLTVIPSKILSFSKSVPISSCLPVTFIFTNTSTASGRNFIWNPGDGSPLVRSRDLTHTYTKSGTYTVRLAAPCAKTISDVIITKGSKVLRQNDTTICAGDKVKLRVRGASRYIWKPATGLSATDIPNPIASPITTTSYTVEMKDILGCTAFDTVKVTVLPKIIVDLKLATSDACDSIQQVSVIDNTGASPPLDFEYTWTTTDGHRMKTANFKSINFDRTGSLDIRVKPGARCLDDSTFSLNVRLSKKYLAFGSTSISQSEVLACNENDPIQLEASGGKTYIWTPTTGLSNSKIANPIASINTSTTYKVKIINAQSCIAERSVFIRVPDQSRFNLKVKKTREYCNTTPKVEFINQSNGIESYFWDFGDGMTNDLPNPIHYYNKGGNYKVRLRVITSDKCIRDTSFQVEIEQAITYNAFSPNGDGINEIFNTGLVGWDIEIYNRWSRLVHTRANYENNWRGEGLAAGTYYYVLTSPTGQVCRGWISLLK